MPGSISPARSDRPILNKGGSRALAMRRDNSEWSSSTTATRGGLDLEFHAGGDLIISQGENIDDEAQQDRIGNASCAVL